MEVIINVIYRFEKKKQQNYYIPDKDQNPGQRATLRICAYEVGIRITFR